MPDESVQPCINKNYLLTYLLTYLRNNKYLTNLVFLGRTVSYGKSRGKNLVRNLPYGPRTRYVRLRYL